jgi:hypothetical protein
MLPRRTDGMKKCSVTHEMEGETVEHEKMWTTKEGRRFTKEILERFLQRLPWQIQYR